MSQMDPVRDGFQSIDAAAEYKERAIVNLQRWLTDDEFAAYRPQLDWLIATKKWSGLLDRFYQILPFGTGGRRGPVGIGPNRMNLWTLGASVQGHCQYLKERFPQRDSWAVAIAYDVRQFEDNRKNYNVDLQNPVLHLSSKGFAQYAAGVYAANGIDVHILPDDNPRYFATPELSFIIRELSAQGGLNISASHNPPDDNGGKFYDERGGQPIPPDDQIMADMVETVTEIKSLSWADAKRSGHIHFLTDDVHDKYIDLCCKQSLVSSPVLDEVKIVFTPLHGVGHMTAMETLQKKGFRVYPVEEQMTPDGQFSNVTKSPNPEVPESMDKATVLAREIGADIVMATDPDADRIGAMMPVNDGADWTPINGNSIAALLTHFKLAKLAETKQLPSAPIVIKTLVTTELVTRIARHFNAQIVDNLLVGFKYIAEVLWQLESKGAYDEVSGAPSDFVIASEESHGILVTPDIRDKDAGGAALLLGEMTLDLKRKGKTVSQYKQEIEKQFGYFSNSVHPVVMPGIEGRELMSRMLQKLRTSPPSEIGGLPVTQFDDLLSEDCWLGPLKGDTDKASRNFMHFRLGDSARIALRPSGTEPKAKAYVEVCSAPKPSQMSDEEWKSNCERIDRQAEEIVSAFLKTVLASVGVTAT